MKKRIISLLLVAVMTMGMLIGCGSSSEEAEETTTEETTEEAAEVTTLTIGCGSSYVPYCYLDEDGNAVGYEYDILAALDEIMEEYEFVYESMTFDNVILSLDSDKIDVAAHQLQRTEEREEKYLLCDEYYTQCDTYICVPSDNNDVTSLADLAGKKVNAGGSTTSGYIFLTNYNEENPDKALEAIASEAVADETCATNLLNGVWDATICQERDKNNMNKDFADGEEAFKIVGDPIIQSYTYYLFNKDDVELKEAFDAALKELRENGTIDEIAAKWLQ